MYNGNKKDSKDIIGRLNLLYTDILGKKYNEGVDIVIKSKYYEDIRKYGNELENIINKEFD